MNKKVLNLILEEEVLKNLKKYEDKESISIEEYVVKILEEFNNVNWGRKSYSINR